jgi:hypothetical protein
VREALLRHRRMADQLPRGQDPGERKHKTADVL